MAHCSSWDSTVRFWHMPSGLPAGTLLFGSSIRSLAFNPTSSRLAVAATFQMLEYDVATQTLIRSYLRGTQPMTGVQFTPDGANVVSSSYDGLINVANAATGIIVRQFPVQFGANTMAISPDGSSVAASVLNQTVRLYRLSDGAVLRTFAPGTFSYSLAFSPDGQSLAAGQLDSLVRIWRASDGALIKTLVGHTGQVNGLAYMADGGLLSASADGTVRVWDAQGNFVRVLTGAGSGLACVALSPDGQFGAGGAQGGRLTVWRISTGQTVYGITAHGTVGSAGGVHSVRFSPSGQAIYTGGGDGSVKVWRASNGALLETYTREVGGPVGPNNGTMSLDISPDGSKVTLARDDGTITTASNALLAVPTSASMYRGLITGGSFGDLADGDDVSLNARVGPVLSSSEPPIQMNLSAQTKVPNPTRLSFLIESRASQSQIRQEIWLRNVQTQAFELVDGRNISRTDQIARIDVTGDFGRFVDPSGNVSARIKWKPAGPLLSYPWNVSVDQAVWSVGL
jgi:WD40 repeat protein